MIYLKNTLSGIVEEFKPIDSKQIGMYNCGPTVYGKVHIGNMRAYIFADLIKNVLIYNNYPVHQVINITDVGHLVSDSDEGADKVEEQAKKEHIDATVITQKYN
jgi:cysteinyl-tRNA synthetase